MTATSATAALCVPYNADKKVTGIVTYSRKYCSLTDVTRQERGKDRAPMFVIKLDRCRFLFDTPRHKLENCLSCLYEVRVTFEEIIGHTPMMTTNNSYTEVIERCSELRQTLKECLMIRFTSPGGAMEEQPSVAVSENALQTEKGTLELSSNSYDRERRTSIEKTTHFELHMKGTAVVQNDEAEKKSSNSKASSVVDGEQSDVSDCVSDFEEDADDPYVLMSGLNDVHTEPEMKFGVDRDYPYNWVDDMWTVYGARPRTRDEREYEADMEKVQAEYEMEFELNRCDPCSLMNGFPNDGTHKENHHELEYSDEARSGVDAVQSVITDENPDVNDCEAHGSYSGVNSVEGDQTEITGNDEASSRMYEERSDVTDEDDLEAHSYDSYSEVNSAEVDRTEKTGNDMTSSGMYDEQSDVTDYGAGCDDSYSSSNEGTIVHSEYDMNVETDSEDSYRWMDGMEAFYGATLKIDHERVEDERARRKEMDIAHWIETVNKEMFPHLTKESQVLRLVESLASSSSGFDGVQSVVTEDEIDRETYSDYSYTNGSQSDHEEDLSEETSEETDESQSAVTDGETDYNGISDDSHSRANRPSKTRDERDYETEMHRCLTDKKQRQEMDVADCAATVNNELLPDLKTAKVENNVVTRGCLGRCLARFFAAARCFFQRFLPRWY